jgi:prepilin peptidase CpaA
MNARDLIWGLALCLTLLAAVVDWRSRRIPNWLTVPGVFIGILMHAVISGWTGAKMSLEGAGLALVLLLPFVLLRALGAGDWKLMGAVGAFLGPVLLLFVLLGSIFMAGVMAVVQVIKARRVKETLVNIAVLVQGFVAFGLRPHPEISIDNPKSLKLPFGVAVAAATILCFIAAHRAL